MTTPITVIPAIDLKDHSVVRLSKGIMESAKVYEKDPLAVARRWVEAGTKRLHLVDLNGAFAGKPIHFDTVASIAKNFPKLEIEIGGGIRDLKTIREYIESGVTYCILGTAAIKNPELLKEACKAYPNRIILGIDAKSGKASAEGWGDDSSISAIELANRFSGQAIESIIYTDIAKDGMMSGMNLESIREMAQEAPFPIIASGGLTSLNDIRELKKIPNVPGVIAGKAIYEGVFTLQEAIQTAC